VKTLLRILKWAGLGFAGLAASLALVFVGLAVYLRGSLPQTRGELTVTGAAAPITITRDAYGVPHIQAQSLDDALFGLGFVHGQDRLWQMELTRRIVQGRVAEIAGPPAATVDVYLRSLGLYRAAQSAAKSIAPDVAPRVAAYAAGVNAAMRAHRGPLPPEFTLAQVTPSAWTVEDSVATVKSLALQLSANAFREAIRVRLLAELTPEQLNEFYPPFPKAAADAWTQAQAVNVKAAAFDRLGFLQDQLDLRGASNNWVVSGARSASGKPLLANDPHLGLTLPAVWYLARLSWPGGEAVGGTVPGIPGIVTGRTRNIAFGLTTTGGDTQDIFVERLNAKDPDAYDTAQGPQKFKTRTETIKVRFGADRQIAVRETAYGPVIPSDEPRLAQYVPKGSVIALRWPALDAQDGTIETSIRILEAKDASEPEIAKAFANYRAPLQSWVYAGIDGSIGKLIPGPIPIRDPRQGSEGMVPSPGWTPGASWTRLTGYAEWPHFRNSAEGWFATANNKVVPDDFPHKVANEWDAPVRFRRIQEMLSAKPVHSIDSFKAMQRDVIDVYAREITPQLLAQTKPSSATASKALDLLKGWDGAMTLDRPQPLIFAAWMRQFMKHVMADEMKDAFSLVWNYWPEFTTRVIQNEGGVARWCDDIGTKDRVEDCGAQLSSSLDTALSELSAAHGADPAAWKWRDAHIGRLNHLGFGQIPGLGGLFNMQVPIPGGAHTIDRADHRLGSSAPFAAVHGSGFRGISDLGNPEASAYIIASGQSGNVYSPHYTDLVPIWAKGDYIDINKPPSAGDAAAHALILSPQSSANAR
jgi:penicillin G amidase